MIRERYVLVLMLIVTLFLIGLTSDDRCRDPEPGEMHLAECKK